MGSAQFGIRRPVLIATRILQEYQEIEIAVGLNAVGVILTALSCRLASEPVSDAQIIVCLRRRRDARPVELALLIQRAWLSNRKCLFIRLADAPGTSPAAAQGKRAGPDRNID